jgi:hypothetical protein
MSFTIDIPFLSDDEDDDLIADTQVTPSLDRNILSKTDMLPTSPSLSKSPNSKPYSKPTKKRTLPASMKRNLNMNDDDEDEDEEEQKPKKKKQTKKAVKPKFKSLTPTKGSQSSQSSSSSSSNKRSRDDDDEELPKSKKTKTEQKKKSDSKQKTTDKKTTTTDKKKKSDNKQTDNFLDGVVLTVSGIGKERGELRDMACKHGAKYINDYSDDVTHVVVADQNPFLTSPKVQSAIRDGRSVISQSWIRDCISKSTKLPERKYLASSRSKGSTAASDNDDPDDDDDIDNLAGEDIVDDWSDEEDDGWRPEPEEDDEYVPSTNSSKKLKTDTKKTQKKQSSQDKQQKDNQSDQKKTSTLANFAVKSDKRKQSQDEDEEEDNEIQTPVVSRSGRMRKKYSDYGLPGSQTSSTDAPTTSQKKDSQSNQTQKQINGSESTSSVSSTTNDLPEWISEKAVEPEVKQLYTFYEQSLKSRTKFLTFLQDIFSSIQESIDSGSKLFTLFDDWKYDIAIPKVLRRINKEYDGDQLTDVVSKVKETFMKLGTSISGEQPEQKQKPKTHSSPGPDTQQGPKDELTEIFTNLHFHLSDLLKADEVRDMKRKIIAYDGDIHLDFNKDKSVITHVIAPLDAPAKRVKQYSQSATVVEPTFINQCIRRKKLVPVEAFIVEGE